MSDLGALLQKAREQRRLSLDDIQELTKIRKRYLEAIEEGNYSVLPGSFYVRAFVKNYAEAVGLDADEVLRLYNKEIPSNVPEQVVEPIQRPRRSQTQSNDRWGKWGFRTLMWSFLLLIIVLVYIYAIKQPSKDNVDSADQTKMTDQTEAPENNPDKATVKNGDNASTNEPTGGKDEVPVTPPPTEEPVEEPVVPATTLTLDRSSGSTDYYKVAPAGAHKIVFNATGRAWVGVKEKNKSGKYILQHQFNKSGETIELDINGPAYINVGRADLVEVTLDGVAMEDGNAANPHRMQLDMVEDDTADTANKTAE
ncbi:helix-turn-helix domain-containing protein [Paenibacillus lignilyticus]|uniref:Helix-turn-helix domain-containing protein n=1 Tax=Paenibacillus lignilyticus TaxID=1172615 RepID=A0ABS5CH25_9BACL|nr:RodZ domain-containing protein [Paenibacillus lignilyticus]MBP3965188.1 helix-turn-helix domain-containing protein [Paenibacillus lignilyticus]